jgi:pimeloyl-ACP methyl ester carboxylesterase
MKWIKRIIIGLLVLILFALLATHFISLNLDDSKIELAFKDIAYVLESHYLSIEDAQLHYITIGDNHKPVLILLHGSPGSWDNWVAMLSKTQLLDYYFILAIDRIPYNKTTIDGAYSLQEQSQFLAPIIAKYCDSCMVAGHSYGGALALQMGSDYEQQISTIVSIAGTIADPYQEPKWYNYAVSYSPARWLLSDDFMASNREMCRLKEDLLQLNQELSGFSNKVILIQGGKDFLVNPRSVDYIKALMVNAELEIYNLPEGDHFLIWTEKDKMESIFISLTPVGQENEEIPG